MIYICIPTHNEQQTVGVVLWKLRQVFTDFPRDYQLLVADDASTDKTPDVLEPYTRVLPLTVIRSDTRQGAAASLEMLLREAVRRSEYPKRDAIVTLQADFSDEPDDLVPLIKRLEAGADVAVGNKVSSAKETRTRRFARSLGLFFMRRQKWPEGVTSPFDGFRAYRLHPVRRAIEERTDRRLIRFDGWAGHAELLRAVLPHARRVDVVNVDDRSDRLQRPRREKLFAAAMQVRTLAGGTEPQGLVGVQELDRIAATTSRSRERAAVSAQAVHGTGTRANGSRTRDRTSSGDSRRESRPRSQGGNGGARSRSGATVEPRRTRAQERARPQDEPRTATPSAGTAAAEVPTGERAQKRKPQGEGRRRKPRTEQVAAGTAEDVVSPTGESPVAPESASRPKRKRRRRKKSGQAGAASAVAAQPGEDVTATPRDRPLRESKSAAAEESGVADSEDAGGEAAEGGTAGERKRRRRGGRRGGRGRRRTRPDGSEVTAGEQAGKETTGSGMADAESSAPIEQGAAQPAARVSLTEE